MWPSTTIAMIVNKRNHQLRNGEYGLVNRGLVSVAAAASEQLWCQGLDEPCPTYSEVICQGEVRMVSHQLWYAV